MESRQPQTSAFYILRKYADDCEAYLNGAQLELPDGKPLLTIPSRSFVSPTIDYTTDVPTVRVKIADRTSKNPRLFDAPYYAYMLLLELAGGRIRMHVNKRRDALNPGYYLVYSAPTKAKGTVRVMRIITDAPNSCTVHQVADHHDYRRAALTFSFINVGSRPKKGRAFAGDLATTLFENNDIANQIMRTEAFRTLLKRMLTIADRVHEKSSRRSTPITDDNTPVRQVLSCAK